jgi:hypothetical protein
MLILYVMNKPIVWIAGLVGILLCVVAIIYFITPANALPPFMPGHEASITKTHFKHGIGALVLGLAVFAFAWFQSGSKKSLVSPQKEDHGEE